MRIFLAGATGAIGSRLVPMLVDAGHDVVGLTRRPERASSLEKAGATAVVGDVLDAQAMADAVAQFRPDVVMHQVTDLPQRQVWLPLKVAGLNKVRRRGTDNLVAAAAGAGARVIAQSVAFPLPGIAQRAVDHLEAAVLGAGGVVLRYGYFYGPGTWSETAPAQGPAVHVDAAAARTVELLDAPSGVVEVTDL